MGVPTATARWSGPLSDPSTSAQRSWMAASRPSVVSPAALITGCETSSSPAYSDVTISPEEATLTVGTGTKVTNKTNRVVFTAGGGDGFYTWAMAYPALGSLVASNRTATYTATMAIGVNTITVRSSGESAYATATQR